MSYNMIPFNGNLSLRKPRQLELLNPRHISTIKGEMAWLP